MKTEQDGVHRIFECFERFTCSKRQMNKSAKAVVDRQCCSIFIRVVNFALKYPTLVFKIEKKHVLPRVSIHSSRDGRGQEFPLKSADNLQ